MEFRAYLSWFHLPPFVNIELINTGSELLLGRVLNTHQQWLCRRLADLGHNVARQVAVPDTARDIQQAVREALARADFVIVTGGLGPTSDDITRDLIAQLLGKKLIARRKSSCTHQKLFCRAQTPDAREQRRAGDGSGRRNRFAESEWNRAGAGNANCSKRKISNRKSKIENRKSAMARDAARPAARIAADV